MSAIFSSGVEVERVFWISEDPLSYLEPVVLLSQLSKIVWLIYIERGGESVAISERSVEPVLAVVVITLVDPRDESQRW